MFNNWIYKLFFLLLFNGPFATSFSQDSVFQNIAKKRQLIVSGINIGGFGGSLIILNNTWYKNYPKSNFHLFNDSKEWLQVDKIGHAWTAYNTGKISTELWKWSGMEHRKALWLGGLSGAAYQTSIEILDAHAEKWGWSWTDMAFNFFGSTLFIAQELKWKEQRIQFKFSFHKNSETEPILLARSRELFGNNWTEKMLKDYNTQTYWLSIPIQLLSKNSKLPSWLNLAVGYGAEGLYGGFENKWIDPLGNEIIRNDIFRNRQFYISPDIDFTKIKTKNRLLKTTFYFLNAFKCPAPAIMFDSKGKLKVHPLYF